LNFLHVYFVHLTCICNVKSIQVNAHEHNRLSSIYVSLRILLTIPATVSSAKRSFSKLKLVTNYLRSTMSQDRLVGIVRLTIESEIARKIYFDNVIAENFTQIGFRGFGKNYQETPSCLVLPTCLRKNINQFKVKLKSIHHNLVETIFDTNRQIN
jgi:hypothetical protein